VIEVVRDSSCEAYTRGLGEGLASLLRGGDAILLVGGLGAGKTTLTRSIVGGLGGNAGIVSSPTFVVINQYDVPLRKDKGNGTNRPQGPLRVAHVDAYRLGGVEELDALGWDRYFAGKKPHNDVIAIVEWPSKLADEAPDPAAVIEIEPIGPSSRRMVIRMPEDWKDRPGFQQFVEREPARCRTTGTWISPTHATYPFADERARDADLHRWFSGQYKISREATAEDVDGVD
jgi:tRNA threonylcarbamoyladenosine biosynthesis protein TsaE